MNLIKLYLWTSVQEHCLFTNLPHFTQPPSADLVTCSRNFLLDLGMSDAAFELLVFFT